MYRFPTWRYWLVIIVLLVGVALALPNVFGEDPALQLARQDRQKMDAAAEQRVLGVLSAKQIPVKRARFEGDRLVLSFAGSELQSKAREALIDGTSGDYSIALAEAPAAPAWMLAIGLRPMGLGLDLRGGIHFLYEVDINSVVTQAMERLERDVRTTLRDERIPYTTVVNDKGLLTVTLRDAAQLDAASKAINKIEDGLVVTTDDSASAPTVSVALSPESIKQRQVQALDQNRVTLSNRVNALGVSEPVVQRQGKDRIVVELPGINDPNEAIRILGSTATLEWHMVDEAHDPYEAQRTKRIPIGSKLYTMRDSGRPILLKRELVVGADQMADARVAFPNGQPAVSVTLDSRGGQAMLKNTQQNVGHRMAVLYIEKTRLAEGETCKGIRVDNECTREEVISDATIRGVFSSKFQIDGLSAGEARDLALLLRTGSLAAPMYLVEQRVVGPSLGADNIRKGVYSLTAGMVLTFFFMAIYYRGFGLIACAVLLANVVLLAALLSLLPTSLSLPGIAGLVLTVGMAVDANILIYERIREELRLGMSPHAAINAGFERAFSAIVDSNVTTLIAGVVLWAIGTGPVRGFAVVLTLGIATSMFTAIIGSRALVHAIWGRRVRIERLPI